MYPTIDSLGALVLLVGPLISGVIIRSSGGYVAFGTYAGQSSFSLSLKITALEIQHVDMPACSSGPLGLVAKLVVVLLTKTQYSALGPWKRKGKV